MITLIVLWMFHPSELSPEHARLDFLAGSWRTESTWPDSGRTVVGALRYEWVLGGTWLKFTFRGEHPDRAYWEAHGMIHWDAEAKAYRTVAFWDARGPHGSTGRFIDEKTVRFTAEGGQSGIDYRDTGSGVYQENWRLDEAGERIVTLKTTYTAQ